MTAFKPGDKVRCISRDYANHLTVGEIYTVVRSNYENLVAMTNKGEVLPGVFPSRFQLVESTSYTVTIPAVVKEFDNAEDALEFFLSNPGSTIQKDGK